MNATALRQWLNDNGFPVSSSGSWNAALDAAVAKAIRNRAHFKALAGAQLSPNFTLGELTNSATARASGLLNNPNAEQLGRMRDLCEHILEPVRAKFGPTRITSGYRCFTPDSQHGKGEAGDFEVPGVPNLTVARWIRDTLKFDQLILEAWSPGAANAGWIHASYRRDRFRGSVLRTPTGKAPYFAGLPA